MVLLLLQLTPAVPRRKVLRGIRGSTSPLAAWAISHLVGCRVLYKTLPPYSCTASRWWPQSISSIGFTACRLVILPYYQPLHLSIPSVLCLRMSGR
jgi:hypothetical protein